MRFLVVNSETGDILEEHNFKNIAHGACRVANAYEVNHDLPPVYVVQPTCPKCDSEDMVRSEMDGHWWECQHCDGNVRI